VRAMTVVPGKAGSARLEDVPEPADAEGSVLVSTLALGTCGTDREIAEGHYGTAPAGEKRLILGHESLGRVESAPKGCGFAPGDLVVGIVRRPDPVPCSACAAGDWDMCHNGRYTERGIKERNGYGAERFRIEPHFTVKIDRALGPLGVLMEPTSVVAKAWDHVMAIGRRGGPWEPKSVLVTGAGPIGLLAALMGKQRGLAVHVFDRDEAGPKPRLVRELGGSYHHGDVAALKEVAPDIVMECTGAVPVIGGVLGLTAPAGIVCLAGVSAPGKTVAVDMGQLNRTLVLGNGVVFGSVNANRHHYEIAADALARADKAWLAGLITRHVPLERWTEALEHRPGDIKVVIDIAAA
jgi:glucose 1-dehydrogenase